MENQKQTSFTFEIDNFWEKVDEIRSPIFLSGGCEWFVQLFPKGNNVEDHVSVYLCVAKPKTLRLGWKRRASFSFIMLNQSGKELGRWPEISRMFCAYTKSWGRAKELPLKKLKEKGSLENSKLIVKVEIQVHEIVDEGGITGKEMVDVGGFQVLCSQAIPVSLLFEKHPDTAANFRQRNQLVKTAFMNLLLGLIETLNKPPHSFTDTELSNARSKLIDLTQVGFNVDWLKTKLDEISLVRKKANAHVQEPEPDDEHMKVELMNMEEMVTSTSQGWLVRSWNEWKVRLGGYGHVRYEKID
ncbi:MATH/TRAF domain-containing protein [Hirschfeldia incana]|nr:MATH/TRAF domain-containing protein [Hirschfeldia incana]